MHRPSAVGVPLPRPGCGRCGRCGRWGHARGRRWRGRLARFVRMGVGAAGGAGAGTTSVPARSGRCPARPGRAACRRAPAGGRRGGGGRRSCARVVSWAPRPASRRPRWSWGQRRGPPWAWPPGERSPAQAASTPGAGRRRHRARQAVRGRHAVARRAVMGASRQVGAYAFARSATGADEGAHDAERRRVRGPRRGGAAGLVVPARRCRAGEPGAGRGDGARVLGDQGDGARRLRRAVLPRVGSPCSSTTTGASGRATANPAR